MIKTPASVLFTSGGLPVSTDASNNLVVTGSSFVFNNPGVPLWVTGSIATAGGIQVITGTVGITSIASPVIVGNLPTTQSVKIDQTIIVPVSVSNSPTVTGSLFVFNNSATQMWVTGAVASTPVGIQTITGSVGITSISSPISVGNFPSTQSVKVDATITLPVSVSNTPSITGSLFVFNNSGSLLWVTGTVVSVPVGVQSVTGTVGITSISSPVSVGNFPTTQSVKIDQTITLPVSISNSPTVTGSLFVFNNATTPIWSTGSMAVFQTGAFSVSVNNFVTTQSVKIDQAITLPVSISNTPTVTGSLFVFNNSGSLLWVTGSVTSTAPAGTQTITGTVGVTSIASPISIGNFPTTQSVKIDQTITLPVSMSNTPTVTGSLFVYNNSSSLLWTTGSHAVFPIGTFAVSVSNGTPVTQSIKIDQSITLPVSVSNSITGSVFVFNNPGVPMWITGSVSTAAGTQTITGTVGVTSIATPISIGNFPSTQSVKIDQSISLPVSMSNTPTVTGSIFVFNNLGTPMWITGSVSTAVGTQTITGTVGVTSIASPISVGNFPATQSVKIDQTITLPVSISNSPTVTGSLFVFNNTNTPMWITGSVSTAAGTQTVTGTVGITSISSPVSVGNFPTTQSVKIDQSIALSVSMSNTPTVTGSMFIFNNQSTPAWVTGSLSIAAVAPSGTQTITGSVGITSIATPVSIKQNAMVSVANSTTQSLPVQGVFTGTADNTLGVNSIQVNIFSDVRSYPGGLQVQQSMDGTNWDIVDSFSILPGIGTSFTIQAVASYVRVVYANDGWAQTTFRLQTVLCPFAEPLPRATGARLSQESLSVVLASDQVVVSTLGKQELDQTEHLTQIHSELQAIRLLLEILTDEKVSDIDTFIRG